LILFAGDIFGITRNTGFTLYASREAMWDSRPIGRATVLTAGGMWFTMKLEDGEVSNVGLRAVAIQTSEPLETFSVRACGESFASVQLAVTQENATLHIARGWPRFNVTSNPHEQVQLVVNTGRTDGQIYFLYDASSTIHKLGLPRLHFSVPHNPTCPDLSALRVREILQASAHFFKYLSCKPASRHTDIFSRSVDASLCELVEGSDIAVVNGRIKHPLVIRKRLTRNQSNAYEVKARSSGDAPGVAKALYGIEIINRLEMDLFVWMFFFDCSSLSIRKFFTNSIAQRKDLTGCGPKARTLSLASPIKGCR
jgi:hypothetical protein